MIMRSCLLRNRGSLMLMQRSPPPRIHIPTRTLCTHPSTTLAQHAHLHTHSENGLIPPHGNPALDRDSQPTSPPPTLLHTLIAQGDLGLMRDMLAVSDIEERDAHGNTPLCVAALCLNVDAVKILISHGANVSTLGAESNTPLHFAIAAQDAEHGKTRQKGGQATLTAARSAQQEDAVRALMDGGASTYALNSRNISPFVLAVRAKRYTLVEIMIEEESKRLLRHTQEELVLDVAYDGRMHVLASVGKASLLRRVLLENALDINQPDVDGHTLLHVAAHRRKPKMFGFLLESGADPKKTANDNWTVLHELCAVGARDMVETLLKRCPELINMVTDVDKVTPLLCAAEEGIVDVCEVLLNHGADVTLPDQYGYTALHHLVGGETSKLLPQVIAMGADVNALTITGVSPLHGAVLLRDCDAITALLRAGADPGLKTRTHTSALEALRSLDSSQEGGKLTKRQLKRATENIQNAVMEFSPYELVVMMRQEVQDQIATLFPANSPSRNGLFVFEAELEDCNDMLKVFARFSKEQLGRSN